MARKRFRWTRERYRKARSLDRYFARHIYDMPSEPPRLVQRLHDLYERHPQRDDPLLANVRHRLNCWGDDIPF